MINYERKKIFSFQKSKFEEVHFYVRDKRGVKFAEIQVFQVEDDGSKVGTHRLITIPRESLSDLREGITRLSEAFGEEKLS